MDFEKLAEGLVAFRKEALTKEAKLRVPVSDIEDYHLDGVNLNEKQEAQARKLIKRKVNKSFVGRHPYLTGIPTLGIAPSIAKGRISRQVAKKLRRTNPDLDKAVRGEQEREFNRNIKLLKATETSRAAQNAASGLMGAAAAYGASKRRDDG